MSFPAPSWMAHEDMGTCTSVPPSQPRVTNEPPFRHRTAHNPFLSSTNIYTQGSQMEQTINSDLIVDATTSALLNVHLAGELFMLELGRVGAWDAFEIGVDKKGIGRPTTFSSTDIFHAIIARTDIVLQNAMEGVEDAHFEFPSSLPPLTPTDIIIGIATSGRTGKRRLIVLRSKIGV
ncbi:hypothetical protein BDQ17DRAFT_1435233 [Cyathus striatus]|nr:hypothetical protein BDQ17DRAFT_1435233 [Cyathus striatus]